MNERNLENRSDGEIMTVHDVAVLLRLSEATIYRLVHAKKIPVIKIGRSLRFHKQVVEEWMRRQSESGQGSEVVPG